MVKESGDPKKVRGGEDGFSKGGRGDEDTRHGSKPKGFAAPQLGARDGRSIAVGESGKKANAHGFGHEGGQVKGVSRYSGDKRAHRVGARKK